MRALNEVEKESEATNRRSSGAETQCWFSAKLRRALFSVLQKCVFGKLVLKLDSLKTKGKYKGEENSFRKNFGRIDPQTREKTYP
ncbi:hypothetical protein FFZ95_09340 [Leptospira borgpetersenii]|nr:hypothetical protein FFZ95_09340 [Leptospira borgpetersenii]TQE56019.1 hypothetical protein FFZ96_11155 [Leptospira borgpetersenii]